MTTYWARCTRSFSCKFEFAGKQMLEALVVHDQHNQIYTFNSDLQSGAPAANRDECRGAPTFSRTASGHATSVLATNDEATFDQIWHHQDALRIAQHFFRNSFVRRRHDRVQNIHRLLQTVNCIFASRTGPRVGSNHAHKAHQQQ